MRRGPKSHCWQGHMASGGSRGGPTHASQPLGGCESSGLVAPSSNLCICDHITASSSVLNVPPDGDTHGGPNFIDIHRLQTSDTAVFWGTSFSSYQEGDPKVTPPTRVTLHQTCTSNSPTPGAPHTSQINWLSSLNPIAPPKPAACHLPRVKIMPPKNVHVQTP